MIGTELASRATERGSKHFFCFWAGGGVQSEQLKHLGFRSCKFEKQFAAVLPVALAATFAKSKCSHHRLLNSPEAQRVRGLSSGHGQRSRRSAAGFVTPWCLVQTCTNGVHPFVHATLRTKWWVCGTSTLMFEGFRSCPLVPVPAGWSPFYCCGAQASGPPLPPQKAW